MAKHSFSNTAIMFFKANGVFNNLAWRLNTALVYKQSEGYSTPIPFFIKTQLSLPGRKPAYRDRS